MSWYWPGPRPPLRAAAIICCGSCMTRNTGQNQSTHVAWRMPARSVRQAMAKSLDFLITTPLLLPNGGTRPWTSLFARAGSSPRSCWCPANDSG